MQKKSEKKYRSQILEYTRSGYIIIIILNSVKGAENVEYVCDINSNAHTYCQECNQILELSNAKRWTHFVYYIAILNT